MKIISIIPAAFVLLISSFSLGSDLNRANEFINLDSFNGSLNIKTNGLEKGLIIRLPEGSTRSDYEISIEQDENFCSLRQEKSEEGYIELITQVITDSGECWLSVRRGSQQLFKLHYLYLIDGLY